MAKLAGCLSVWVVNNISGLRRPKNVTFSTYLASSMRMMRTLRFFGKFFNCGKICRKPPKIGQNAILLHTLPLKPETVDMWKLAQT